MEDPVAQTVEEVVPEVFIIPCVGFYSILSIINQIYYSHFKYFSDVIPLQYFIAAGCQECYRPCGCFN